MQHLQFNTTLQGGKYKILNVLGQGGFGVTYLAEQTALGRYVAIKEFFMKEFCERDEFTNSVTISSSGGRETIERFREKFLKEARNIAKLNHPHIIRIIDVFEENETAYYVMEYMGGGSLATKVSDGNALSETDAMRYILQVAEALSYIHQKKISHLDVKPSNIMLSEKGEVVLVDFGLSKQYDEVGVETSSTPVGISEGYAPMEQYRRGGVREFSPEADIYALGATFFKLLTGKTPPNAFDIEEKGFPRDILKSAGVSKKNIDVIASSMEPRKRNRIHNAEIFISKLKQESKPRFPVSLSLRVVFWGIVVIAIVGIGIIINERFFTEHYDSSDRVFKVNGISFVMKRVEGGTYNMGSNDGDSTVRPVHPVTLTSYYIGQTEVTQGLWKAVLDSVLPKQHIIGDNLPIADISKSDCERFISKLNQLTGRQFRLPTEAEWEFAARGGKKSNGYKYAGSNNLDDVAWYKHNSNEQRKPVATKKPNELGLYDMCGNVYEWCEDVWIRYPDSAVTDPFNVNSLGSDLRRGGAFRSEENDCCVYSRDGCEGESSSLTMSVSEYALQISTGLRLAMYDDNGGRHEMVTVSPK